MREYTDLLAAANSETWAIRPQSLRAMLMSAKNGEHAARPTKLPKVQGKIAVIPIHGLISQRGSIWDELFGGTSTMRFEAAFSRAYNEPQIGAIVLDIDSPGGTTDGLQMAADRVYETRGKGKPVISVVNSMCCSAAYWIASGAEHFYSVPGATHIGCIGCYREHEDISKMAELMGVKRTFIYQPAFKVEGNEFEPLSAEAKEFHQTQVDHAFDVFNATVARHRGVSPTHARESFGKGRSVYAEMAKEMGLIDKIASMEAIFKELTRGAPSDSNQSESKSLTEQLCQAWESGQPEELVFKPKTTGETTKRRKAMLEKRMAW